MQPQKALGWKESGVVSRAFFTFSPSLRHNDIIQTPWGLVLFFHYLHVCAMRSLSFLGTGFDGITCGPLCSFDLPSISGRGLQGPGPPRGRAELPEIRPQFVLQRVRPDFQDNGH